MSRNSKNNSKAASRVQSGTATPVVLEPLVPITTVLGLNFGGSFSSISLLNKASSLSRSSHRIVLMLLGT